MEKKTTRVRKPKAQVDQPIVNEVVEQTIVNEVVEQEPEAPQAPKQEVTENPAYMYRCMECGQVNLVKRCQRCSSVLVRPI
jgi:predicted RNA-binding Zn-ribbon protein involved in translation (DUF1610 family)